MPRKAETNLQAQILRAMSEVQAGKFWRNNGGQAVFLPPYLLEKFLRQFPEARSQIRYVEYGLCVGSGDLIGLRSEIITPEMVGQTVARFVSVEVKTADGTESPEQGMFRHMVNSRGGLAFVARSAEEAVEYLQGRKP